MKIVFIGQKGIPAIAGGVERHVEELATRLALDTKCDVVVYTRPWYTARRLKRCQGVRLVSLPSIRTKHLDAITHTLFTLLHAAVVERPDIIHIHAVGPALFTWLARVLAPRAKVIVTFHCIDRQHQKWGKFAKMMLWLGEWMAVKCAHEVIAVSKNLQQYIFEVYGRKSTYIPNGIAETTPQPASIITEQFDLKTNEYIVMVARLVRHKGAHYLINAFKELATEKKLVIVGDTSFTNDYALELKTLASSDPRILFTGVQTGKALAELYSNAYCVVLPSESEGLPFVILEAQAFGKAVIASDIPGNLEVMGENGISFPRGDVDALREALRAVLDSPEYVEALGKQARTTVLAKYHWNDIVSKTQELYHDLITCYTPSGVTPLRPIH